MNAASDSPLSEFPRGHATARAKTSSRVIAGILTAALYSLLAFLAGYRTIWMSPERPEPSEIVTKLVPDVPIRKLVLSPPPFLTRLLRPRAVAVAAPVFTVASAAPAAPARLSPSAVPSSPLAGGAPMGNGAATGQDAQNGRNGNGPALGSCYDAAWAQAVTDRIHEFLHYPRRAIDRHMTGVVFVHLVVRRDGRLDFLEIAKSSGHTALDEAAYNAVRDAQPLPRIPQRMHTDRIDAELPVAFGVKGHFKATGGSCGG